MRHALLSASTLAVALALSSTALAGPPLICHPFDIGTSRSLPIGPSDGGWSSIDASYDTSRLVSDTLALLTPSTPTIVRMETLRRATMYVTDDAPGARQLLRALRTRASKRPTSRAEAMALFDVGYLVETYRQLGAHEPALAQATGGLDGYALVAGAIRVVGDDPALHFAAALMTMDGAHVEAHSAHAAQARAGGADALLARNVRTHLREAV